MKKSCAIGCAVLAILVAALIGVVMTQAPHWWARGKTFVLATMAEEQRISAFESAWTAPPPDAASGWAPPQAGEWTLEAGAKKSDWQEWKLDRAGWQATYKQAGRTIEVSALPATELERPELLKRVTEAAEARATAITRKTIGNGSVTLSTNSGQTTTTMGNRTHLQLGGEHLRIWWLKDWLFVFRAKEDPAGFAEEYLRAIGTPAL